MRKHILIILSCLLCSVCASAQWKSATSQPKQYVDSTLYDNPLKIHQDLYEMYMRAVKQRSNESCIAVGDSMIDLARKMGEQKAECIAVTIPLTYATGVKDIDQIQYWGERLKKISLEYDYEPYYYYACQLMISPLLSKERYVAARQLIDEMFQTAESTGSKYGLYACNWQMGAFYQSRRNSELAAKYYLAALELSGQDGVNQSPLDCYLHLSSIYGKDGNSEKELEYAEKGLASDITGNESSEISLLDHKLNALYFLGRFDEFDKAAVRLDEVLAEWGKDVNTYYRKAPVLRAMRVKNYNLALELLEDFKGNADAYRLRSRVYQEMGRWPEAVQEMEKMAAYVQKEINITMEDDLADMAAEIGNAQLLAENERLGAENDRLGEVTRNARHHTLAMVLISVLSLGVIFALVTILRTRRHLKQLRKAHDVKDQFISSMSHELRTPLNAVVGFSQVLASSDNFGPEEKQQYTGYILENSTMLTMMMDDILDSVDMQSGNLNSEPRDTNVRNLCELVMGGTRNYRPAGVEMRVESDLAPGFSIKTDARRVQHILTNLLSNACKNTIQGSITLSYAVSGSEVVFSVADTGIGVPASQAEEIFGRFVKLDQFKPGSGLGLAVSRDIAQHLHGRVWLDTAYTSGARFCLSLPLQ